jgi:hypothetical protein
VLGAGPQPDSTTIATITINVKCMITRLSHALGNLCFRADIVTPTRNDAQEEATPHLA